MEVVKRQLPKVLLAAKMQAVQSCAIGKNAGHDKTAPYEKGPWDKGHWANRK